MVACTQTKYSQQNSDHNNKITYLLTFAADMFFVFYSFLGQGVIQDMSDITCHNDLFDCN